MLPHHHYASKANYCFSRTGRKSWYSNCYSYVHLCFFLLYLRASSSAAPIEETVTSVNKPSQTSPASYTDFIILFLLFPALLNPVALLFLLLVVFFLRRRRLQRVQQASYANGRPGAVGTGGAASQAYYGGGSANYGYAPQQPYGAPPLSTPGGNQQYYEQQSQTYNYGPSAEGWQPPPPKYSPPPPEVQNAMKGAEGSSNNTNSNSTASPYAPPAGPPPGNTTTSYQQPPQAGNDSRV